MLIYFKYITLSMTVLIYILSPNYHTKINAADFNPLEEEKISTEDQPQESSTFTRRKVTKISTVDLPIIHPTDTESKQSKLQALLQQKGITAIKLPLSTSQYLGCAYTHKARCKQDLEQHYYTYFTHKDIVHPDGNYSTIYGVNLYNHTSEVPDSHICIAVYDTQAIYTTQAGDLKIIRWEEQFLNARQTSLKQLLLDTSEGQQTICWQNSAMQPRNLNVLKEMSRYAEYLSRHILSMPEDYLRFEGCTEDTPRYYKIAATSIKCQRNGYTYQAVVKIADILVEIMLEQTKLFQSIPRPQLVSHMANLWTTVQECLMYLNEILHCRSATIKPLPITDGRDIVPYSFHYDQYDEVLIDAVVPVIAAASSSRIMLEFHVMLNCRAITRAIFFSINNLRSPYNTPDILANLATEITKLQEGGSYIAKVEDEELKISLQIANTIMPDMLKISDIDSKDATNRLYQYYTHIFKSAQEAAEAIALAAKCVSDQLPIEQGDKLLS